MMVCEMRFLENVPRFLFFTGKGGVGKTSVACATAVRLAALERRVLLVSTDPASNLGQVFGLTIGNHVTAIPAVPGLAALEIDPEQAVEAYRERIIGPVRGMVPDEELASITEGLSGSCTTEIASFDEFTQLLTDDSAYGQYDHILFDTAPTGHTIRLLQLPGSWTEFLSTAAMRRVSARSRDSTSTARHTQPRWKPSSTPPAPGSFWSRARSPPR